MYFNFNNIDIQYFITDIILNNIDIYYNNFDIIILIIYIIILNLYTNIRYIYIEFRNIGINIENIYTILTNIYTFSSLNQVSAVIHGFLCHQEGAFTLSLRVGVLAPSWQSPPLCHCEGVPPWRHSLAMTLKLFIVKQKTPLATGLLNRNKLNLLD